MQCPGDTATTIGNAGDGLSPDSLSATLATPLFLRDALQLRGIFMHAYRATHFRSTSCRAARCRPAPYIHGNPRCHSKDRSYDHKDRCRSHDIGCRLQNPGSRHRSQIAAFLPLDIARRRAFEWWRWCQPIRQTYGSVASLLYGNGCIPLPASTHYCLAAAKVASRVPCATCSGDIRNRSTHGRKSDRSFS